MHFNKRLIEVWQEERINDVEKQIMKFQNEDFHDNNFLARFQTYINEITCLTRKIVIDFIEEIIVDNEKNINIKFKFEDELKKYQSIFDK